MFAVSMTLDTPEKQPPSGDNHNSIPRKSVQSWRDVYSFVLIFGCPAAGKGAMCDKLYHDPELAHQRLYHLSVGAYLRELRDSGLLDTYVAQDLAEQKLISGETLVKIIEEKVTDECMNQDHRVMLLDGFPRNQEQMERFTEKFSYTFAISVDTEYHIAKERFKARKDASRAHDNVEIFEKRYGEYVMNKAELIEPIRKAGLLVEVAAEVWQQDIDDAYAVLKKEMKKHHVAKKLFEPRG